MPDTLLDVPQSLTPAQAREALIAAYAAELLDNPPVQSVAEGRPDREIAAQRFARKDVIRLFKAAEAAGLTIRVERDSGTGGTGS